MSGDDERNHGTGNSSLRYWSNVDTIYICPGESYESQESNDGDVKKLFHFRNSNSLKAILLYCSVDSDFAGSVRSERSGEVSMQFFSSWSSNLCSWHRASSHKIQCPRPIVYDIKIRDSGRTVVSIDKLEYDRISWVASVLDQSLLKIHSRAWCCGNYE